MDVNHDREEGLLAAAAAAAGRPLGPVDVEPETVLALVKTGPGAQTRGSELGSVKGLRRVWYRPGKAEAVLPTRVLGVGDAEPGLDGFWVGGVGGERLASICALAELDFWSCG